MTLIRSIAFVVLLLLPFHAFADDPAAASPPTKVSPNGRFLLTKDGKPFFYLGDTAWELFHRLNRDEANDYHLGTKFSYEVDM